MSELNEKKNLCNRLIKKINRGETFTIETFADMGFLIRALKKDIEYRWRPFDQKPKTDGQYLTQSPGGRYIVRDFKDGRWLDGYGHDLIKKQPYYLRIKRWKYIDTEEE